MKISNRLIGQEHPPFVIAEMSGNHNQSLDRALEIVEAAADAGADAIKLQTYTPDTMTLDIHDGSFRVSDKSSLWHGKTLHSLYSQAYTPWEWHETIFEYAKKKNLICFSSPFDETAVDFLLGLDVPAFKIASFENIHLPLIKKVASTGKPLIISTGMATLAEIDTCVSTAVQYGCRDLVLLKCTSTYPSNPAYSNIATIPHLRAIYKCEVGLSDHTLGCGVSVASIALGASVIEKHFTLSREDGGVDSKFSMEPSEFSTLCNEVLRAWQSLGSISYGPTEPEKKSLIFRRSIYATADILEGETFTASNIAIIRPGDGAHPFLYEHILGSMAPKSYKAGSPILL